MSEKSPLPAAAVPAVDVHFQTEPSDADLKRRSIRGSAVTLVAEATRFILQLVATAILARLVSPSDFGLVAMVTALTGFMWLFSDMGLSAATIQQSQISQEQVSSLFWINVAFGSALAVVGIAAAPVVAWFYSEPRLIGIMIVLSSTFVLSGLTAQHYALLVRRMSFGAATFVQTGAPLIGSMISIVMAARGWGYLSLLANVVGTSLAAGVMCWLLSGWRPSKPAGAANLWTMLQFGGALTGSNALTYCIRNLDNVVVGRFSGAAALGLYSKAYGLVLLPVQQICHPLKGVLLPVLSRLQDDPARYRRYFLAALGLLSLGGMPLVAFATADAGPLVLTFLGPKWLNAVPLFHYLGIGAFVSIAMATTDWVLISRGRADRLLKWYLISAPLTVLSFLVGIHWGTAGVAIAFSAINCVLVIPNFWWALADSPIRMSDVLQQVWRPGTASIVAAILLVCGVSRWPSHALPVVQLAMHAPILGILYLAILMLIPGGRRFVIGSISVLKQRS